MTRKHLYPNAQNTEPRAPANEFEAAMEQVLGELREGLDAVKLLVQRDAVPEFEVR